MQNKRSGPYSSYSSSKDVMASGLASSSASQVSQALAESPRTIHPLVQPMLSSPSAIDFDTQRSFSVLSQHILKLEQEITNLKQAQNASTASSSREASSSPPASTGVEEHPVTVLNNAASADADVQLSSQLKRMTLSSNHSRHFGPSSTMSLIGVALQVGEEKNRSKIPDDNHTFRRPQFWSVHPWEYIPEEEAPIQDFPHPELMHELVSLFFEHVNPHFPLLHQPTFEKGIKKGLHLTDHNFGSTLLGVCAVASRYTDNPGVLLEGNDSRFAAGWKCYDLDLPVECDDEYWEPVDPLLAPQQPPGKPTKLSSFIAFIKLMEILEHAQRTLVSLPLGLK
ncbi:hypothetical protein DXG01_005063 [Tephrocybe rancida]|nr:hypothetical protein DXG01_005063 [Tephrocybe rancida]